MQIANYCKTRVTKQSNEHVRYSVEVARVMAKAHKIRRKRGMVAPDSNIREYGATSNGRTDMTDVLLATKGQGINRYSKMGKEGEKKR